MHTYRDFKLRYNQVQDVSVKYLKLFLSKNNFIILQKYDNRNFSFFQLGKEGPIHAIEWSPKNTEFCVVYGFMPAKATLFNTKCEAIFEFGTLHRNSVYYNPHGNNILLLLYS